MPSTTISKENANAVLTVDKLNIIFQLRYHDRRSFRESFVSALSSPVDWAFRAPDSLHVLKDVSFKIHNGDRVAILGVNGSGKTTLCRTIAGMLFPASGTITVRGSCKGVFSTSVGVIPELTGRENGRLLARLLYPAESQRNLDALVAEALLFSELGDFLDVSYETYSQGMKARLFLSILSARTSDLLILDEVYDTTDAFFRKKMTARLRKIIDQSGAFLFVSHSIEQVRDLCNRGIVLNNNQIVFDGPIENAIHAYQFLNGALPWKTE